MERLLQELGRAERMVEYYRGKLESGSAINEEVENEYRKAMVKWADDQEEIKKLIKLQKKNKKRRKP